MYPIRWSIAVVIVVSLVGCGGRGKVPRGAEKEPVNARCIAVLGQEDLFSGAIVSEGPLVSAWASFICTAAINDHPDLLMIIAFYSPPSPGQPIMQLRVGAPSQRSDRLPSEVIPRVVCDLTISELDQVLAHGIPEALSQAMAAKVKEHDVKTQGPLVTEVLYLPTDMFFRIEPAPYFAPP